MRAFCYTIPMIELRKVTWYSQLLAVILFVGVFFLGYWLGTKRDMHSSEPTVEFPVDVSYACSDEKSLIAVYEEDRVSLKLSDGRDVMLPQTIAASGIRYANEDESFVFWSKGNDAFVEENGTTTYAQCSEAPLPV